jgi:hypothetical protein
MAVIDSGPVSATHKFDDVPKEKWRDLVSARKRFLAVKINYDCRCLIQFCEEAEQVWQELGYESAADMIQRGYKLEPVEIDLAVAWLKHNEPETEISIQEVSKRVRIQQLAADNPKWTQQRIADEVGVSQQYVDKVTTKSCESQKSVVIPDSIKSSRDRADFRKLPEELREQVAAKEISLNAAAIRAGIRKKPTPLQELLRAWNKASQEERTEFMKRKDQQ